MAHNMSTAYLNGTYLPLSEARISPLDRGFLFGDGIYEVVPCHGGRLVGFDLHLERMQAGLNAVEIDVQLNRRAWQDIANRLVELNGGGNLVSLLDRVGGDGGEILFEVPGAARFGVA